MILVTGANGFIGAALVDRLSRERIAVRACVRREVVAKLDGVQTVWGYQLTGDADWCEALEGIRVVVHTAARVHVMDDTSYDPLSEFRRTNVYGTLNLARQAASSGVRRFIFISSIKVNGETTKPDRPFTADDIPAPLDFYGISKMEAERGLHEIAEKAGMELVIIRPPLVYGPGVKANFASLMQAVQNNWPLPLGAIRNKRSFISIDNLVDIIIASISHPQAADQIFLVSDGHDLSTAELVNNLAHAYGVQARLLPIPVWVLLAGATILGKRDALRRLCENLQVDISKVRDMLGWIPPISVEEGLKRSVAGIQKV